MDNMPVSSNSALGLIEVHGFVGAVEGADASLKAASVSLVGVEAVKGGITTVMITGEVAAVKAGVEAARAALAKIGIQSKTHVIARMAEDTAMLVNAQSSNIKDRKGHNLMRGKSMLKQRSSSACKYVADVQGSTPPEKMTMQELRSHARKIGLSDSKVRVAKKDELLKLVNKFIVEGKEE